MPERDRWLMLGAMLALGAPAPSTATLYTVHMEGTLFSVHDTTADETLGSPGALKAEFGIAVGTPFEVVYTVDGSVPGTETTGGISYRNAVVDITATVAGLDFEYNLDHPTTFIVVNDDTDFPVPESPVDFWQLTSVLRRPDAFSLPGDDEIFDLNVASWTANDYDAGAFDGGDLLPAPPEAEYEINRFGFNQGGIATCHPHPRELCERGGPGYRSGRIAVHGNVDSWFVVPEPSLLLLALCLAAFAACTLRTPPRQDP